MQMNVRMTGEELFNLGSFVRGEIIRNDVDLFALSLMSDDLREEGYKLCRGVTLSGFAQHFAGAGVESCIQRKCAMTVVLKAVTFGSPWRERQHRVFAIQRLNGRCLIDAEQRCMLRRIEVQANDVSGFGLELRIVGRHIALQSMRSKPVLGPYSGHRHMRYCTEFTCKLTTRPVSRSISGLSLARPSQNLSFHSLVDLVTCPPSMAAKQPRQPFGDKPAPPARDKSSVAVELVTDRHPLGSLGQQQNQSRSARLRRANRLRRLICSNSLRSIIVSVISFIKTLDAIHRLQF